MAKLCKFGCGNELTWNTTGNFYADATGAKHNCPNYGKQQAPKTNVSNPPPAQTGTPRKSDNYYEGVRKVFEFNMIDANGQLQDPKWHILKIVEQQTPIPNSPSTQTVITYILGYRE